MNVDMLLTCAAGHEWRVELDGARVVPGASPGEIILQLPVDSLGLCEECHKPWVKLRASIWPS